MKIAMVCRRKILHVFQSLPHNKVSLTRKREFSEKLSDSIINDVPQEDLFMVAGDMNCHIGSTRDGFEEVMGCFGYDLKKK